MALVESVYPVSVTNVSTHTVSAPGFSTLAPGETRTRSFTTFDIDRFRLGLDALEARGEITWDSEYRRRDGTVHFNIGRIATPTTAPTPGTPDVDAMSEFGQIGMYRPATITVIHLHLIQGGTGVDLAFDVFRRRSGVLTLIAQVSASGTVSDFHTSGAVPSGALAEIQAFDYLFCQTTASTSGGTDGLTIDLHTKN